MTARTDRLLTVTEAAQHAGVSERTVYRWLRDEGLPRLQPAGPKGAIRIDAEELRGFLNRDSRRRLADRVHVALPRARQRLDNPAEAV